MDDKLVCADSTFFLGTIPDSSVDICITSPPYKDSDGYNQVYIAQILSQIGRVLKPEALFFLNFGHLAEDKQRPFRVCDMAAERVGPLNETIIWVKNHYRPIQGDRRVNNLTEFIFVFYKHKMPKLDRLSIGVPYKDKSNAKRFAGGRDLKCAGNVWYIDYETITSKDEKLHNDRFPLELPLRCLKLSGLKKGVVLEPFAGSGTTCLAAKQLGLNYIGIEKNLKNYLIAKKRLTES